MNLRMKRIVTIRDTHSDTHQVDNDNSHNMIVIMMIVIMMTVIMTQNQIILNQE